MGQETILGREPFFYVEVDLDFCDLTYGVGACTASGSAGEECYNTFATCQDRANYDLTTKTYKFCSSEVRPPLGFEAFPAIAGSPIITPARLVVEGGIGQRGAVTIKVKDFPHDDRGIDPYQATRPNDPAGTFFNKLRRRNPFYINRPLRLVTGYLSGGAIVDTVERLYLINTFDGADRNGQFKINAKDVLKLADDKSSVFPPELDVMTTTALSKTQTTITVRTGDGAKVQALISSMATDRYAGIKIDEELIQVNSVAGDALTVGRAWNRSKAAAHDANSPAVAAVGWWTATNGVNVVDIINDLLTIYAGIDAAVIPYNDNPSIPDEWDDEKANWLSGNGLNCWISEQTKVSKLLAQICEQNSLSLWYNEVEQKIKMSASNISLGNQTPTSIDDQANIIADSFTMVEDIDSRVSQIWIYYDPNDYGESMTDAKNYRALNIYVNDTFELDEAYGEPRIKKIYAWWLSNINAGIVSTMASRLITKDLTQNFKLTFTLDAKDAALWTGEYALLDYPDLQGVDGSRETQKIHITQVKEKEPGHLYEYKATAKVFDEQERFFFIATNTVGDYSTASDAEKLANGFISDGGAAFPDGGEPYSITG